MRTFWSFLHLRHPFGAFSDFLFSVGLRPRLLSDTPSGHKESVGLRFYYSKLIGLGETIFLLHCFRLDLLQRLGSGLANVFVLILQ